MEYSYYETRSTLIISIYSPPKYRDKINVSLLNKDILVVGNKEIKLLKKVSRVKEIINDEYKTEILIEKQVEEKWNRLNQLTGPEGVYSPRKLDIPQEKKHSKTLISLLQELYEKGSDETKIAMNKSFLESEGTVICTDVKKFYK